MFLIVRPAQSLILSKYRWRDTMPARFDVNLFIGKQYGQAKILEDKGQDRHGNTTVRALCLSCNREWVTKLGSFLNGHTTSCGCSRLPHFLGRTFGRLKVIGITKDGRKSLLRCQCSCSDQTITSVSAYGLQKGLSKSCGCLRAALLQLPAAEGGFLRLLRTYRRSAKDRGLSFDLTSDQFRRLTSQICHYCGTSPTHTVNSIGNSNEDHSTYKYNGIDRVDNDIGYQESNCVTCCKTCNVAKGTLPVSAFLNWLARIVMHQTKSAA